MLFRSKAKKVHTNRLRQERDNGVMQQLDIQSMRNIEQGKDNKDVLRKKQKLRDLPTHSIWDKCVTHDDFKSVTLDHIINDLPLARATQ